MKLKSIVKMAITPIGKNIFDKISYWGKIAPVKLKHQEMAARITMNIINLFGN